MPKRLVLLLAFAAGATVANLYYSQPLLAKMAAEFHVTSAAVSVVSMATQLGYAAGLLFLVPLGDAIERRRLIVTTTAVVTAALILVSLSHGLDSLIASSFILGAATIVPQIVVPFAAHLASEEKRGQTVGTVMSGLLIGVILSRSVSGYLAAYIGWRTTYLAAAVAMAILAVVLRYALPVEEPDVDLRYRQLMRSLGEVVRTQPVVRRHAVIGAFGFAAFSMLWTTLAFQLASLSPSYGTQTVGAFGIIGVTGALAAPLAGRFSDRFGPRVMNGTGLALISAAFVVAWAFGGGLAGLAIAVVLLDAGAQTSHVSNQSQIFALDPALRNRMNAVYMVAYFIGGAAGSAIAGQAWARGGWTAVCVAGGLCGVLGMVPLFRSSARSSRPRPARVSPDGE